MKHTQLFLLLVLFIFSAVMTGCEEDDESGGGDSSSDTVTAADVNLALTAYSQGISSAYSAAFSVNQPLRHIAGSLVVPKDGGALNVRIPSSVLNGAPDLNLDMQFHSSEVTANGLTETYYNYEYTVSIVIETSSDYTSASWTMTFSNYYYSQIYIDGTVYQYFSYDSSYYFYAYYSGSLDFSGAINFPMGFYQTYEYDSSGYSCGGYMSIDSTYYYYDSDCSGVSTTDSGSGGGGTGGGDTGGDTQLGVWTSDSTWNSPITVNIDGSYAGSLYYYYTLTPNCGDSAVVTQSVSAGSHSVSAHDSGSSSVWPQEYFNVPSGTCLTVELY